MWVQTEDILLQKKMVKNVTKIPRRTEEISTAIRFHFLFIFVIQILIYSTQEISDTDQVMLYYLSRKIKVYEYFVVGAIHTVCSV